MNAQRMPVQLPGRMTATFDVAPQQTYPANRYCVEDGCFTRLSIYNRGRHCFLHDPEPSLVEIRKNLKLGWDIPQRDPLTEKPCTKCGVVFPLTTEFWYRSSNGHGVQGFKSQCKGCIRQTERDKKRKRRRS